MPIKARHNDAYGYVWPNVLRNDALRSDHHNDGEALRCNGDHKTPWVCLRVQPTFYGTTLHESEALRCTTQDVEMGMMPTGVA